MCMVAIHRWSWALIHRAADDGRRSAHGRPGPPPAASRAGFFAHLTARRDQPDHRMFQTGVRPLGMTKFAYYKKLTLRQQRIYDRSDGVPSVRVPAAAPLHEVTMRIAAALEADDRAGTETASQRLVDGLVHRLHVAPVDTRVLAVRPSTSR